MNTKLTTEVLQQETRSFRGTGGVSAECRCRAFHPAFRDARTGIVYLSRYADGRLAPLHLLAGLPADLAVQRDGHGRVLAVDGAVVAGFVRDGLFYTRDEAARAVARDDAATGTC